MGRPGKLEPTSFTWAWVSVGVALELLAPRLPRFGFFSGAQGIWIATALVQPQWTWLAGMACAGCLLLRIARSAQPSGWGFLEALADLQPLWLGLGVSHYFGQPGLAPVIWWLTWWLQPAYVNSALLPEIASEWALYRARLSLAGGGIAILAGLGSWLPGDQALPALLLGGALHSLVLSASAVVRGVDADQQQVEQRRKERGLRERAQGLERMQEGLQETDKKQRKTAAELEVRLETYELMDEMLEAIPQRPVFEAVAQLIVEKLQRRFGITNALLFWSSEDQILPVASVTPYPERVASAPLTRFREPTVERALGSGQMQVGSAQEGGDRLFPEDQWCVAVPVQNSRQTLNPTQAQGALYLGHPNARRLSDEDVHFLQVLARHAVLALDSAAWYQTLQTSLQREATTAARNEALVQRLALVIDGVTQLIRLREPAAMLDSAGHILDQLIPHRGFFAEAGVGEQKAQVVRGQQQAEEEKVLALLHRVRQQERPLLLNDPPTLAVPFLSERGSLGALVLTRESPDFTREDQDILSVLSYQLASALVSAQLFAELQKTHQALRDSQAQLVQSSKMAAVGQLAGGVAHELNTPLGAMALAIESAQLTLEKKPEKASARLQRASKAVQQMKEIVSKLLFYSRDARSGWRETNLHQVLEDTLQMVGHQLRLDNIEVVQQLEEVPNIQANPNELQQILTNLILNARDAMLSPGAVGKRLLISIGPLPDGCWVRVQDQGCGMPTEVMERIFEPFYTTKEVGKGTGLGLSVTTQLVDQHGGKIAVRSQPGQGTQFEVRLPLAPPAEG